MSDFIQMQWFYGEIWFRHRILQQDASVLYVRPGISRNGRRSQEPVASYSGITLGYQVKERLQMTQKIELPEGWFMKLVDGVIEDRKKMCPELRKFYDELAQGYFTFFAAFER